MMTGFSLETDSRGAPAAERLNYTSYRLAKAINRAAENSALARGITHAQFLILQVLGEGKPMSNAQLGRRTFVSSQAAHVVATELLAKGLIERGEHPTNRRVRLMRLTDSGWKALAECTVEIRELEGRLRAALTPTEGEALTHTLARSAEILAGGYFGDAEAEAEAVSRRKTSPSKPSRP